MKKNNRKTTNKTKNRAKKKRCATKQLTNGDVEKHELYRHHRGNLAGTDGAKHIGRKSGAFYFSGKNDKHAHFKIGHFVTGAKDEKLADEIVAVERQISKIFKKMTIPTLSASEIKILTKEAGLSPIGYNLDNNEGWEQIENIAKNLKMRKWVRANRDISTVYASAISNFFMCSVDKLNGFLTEEELKFVFGGRYFSEEGLYNRKVFLEGLVELYKNKGNDTFVSFLHMMSSMGHVQQTTKGRLSGTARAADTLERLLSRTNLNETELFVAKLLNEKLSKKLPYSKEFSFLVDNADACIHKGVEGESEYVLVDDQKALNPFLDISKKGIRYETAKFLYQALVLYDMQKRQEYGEGGGYDHSVSTLSTTANIVTDDYGDRFKQYLNYIDTLEPVNVSNDNQELRMVAE